MWRILYQHVGVGKFHVQAAVSPRALPRRLHAGTGDPDPVQYSDNQIGSVPQPFAPPNPLPGPDAAVPVAPSRPGRPANVCAVEERVPDTFERFLHAERGWPSLLARLPNSSAWGARAVSCSRVGQRSELAWERGTAHRQVDHGLAGPACPALASATNESRTRQI